MSHNGLDSSVYAEKIINGDGSKAHSFAVIEEMQSDMLKRCTIDDPEIMLMLKDLSEAGGYPSSIRKHATSILASLKEIYPESPEVKPTSKAARLLKLES